MERISFVDFYKKNNISPVSQDVSNLEKHFQRRSALIRSLGLPEFSIKGTSVIEFGPGSGHNALFTASLEPRLYYLVDGNTVGLESAKKLLKPPSNIEIQFIESLFEEYFSSKKFELVWAENCISHQANPKKILKHISSFTDKNGVLVFTTHSGASYLSETIRRIGAYINTRDIHDLNAQLEKLTPFFARHLSHLKNMSRPVKDWILDSLLNPLEFSKIMNLEDAIAVLNDDFEFFHSSPKFIRDLRWYKDQIFEHRQYNKIALNCYYKNNLSFLDYRYDFPETDEEFGIELERKCLHAWDEMCAIQKNNSLDLNNFITNAMEIAELIGGISPKTTLAINESLEWLENGAVLDRNYKNLEQWWGKGTQYLSFIRK